METYLSEGTFLALLCAIKKGGPRPSGEKMGETENITEPDILIELVKIYNPLFKPADSYGSVKTNMSQYKSCQKSIFGYNAFGLDNEDLRGDFDQAIKTHYREKVYAMDSFIDGYLNCTDVRPVKRLVWALLFIIQHDSTISPAEPFYISTDGKPIDKASLLHQTTFTFAAFLLGLWHYIIMVHRDNEKGKATFNFFFTQNIRNGRYKFADTLPEEVPQNPIYLEFGVPEQDNIETAPSEESAPPEPTNSPQTDAPEASKSEILPPAARITPEDLPKYGNYYNLIVGFPPLETMVSAPGSDMPDNPHTAPGTEFWILAD